MKLKVLSNIPFLPPIRCDVTYYRHLSCAAAVSMAPDVRIVSKDWLLDSVAEYEVKAFDTCYSIVIK